MIRSHGDQDRTSNPKNSIFEGKTKLLKRLCNFVFVAPIVHDPSWLVTTIVLADPQRRWFHRSRLHRKVRGGNLLRWVNHGYRLMCSYDSPDFFYVYPRPHFLTTAVVHDRSPQENINMYNSWKTQHVPLNMCCDKSSSFCTWKSWKLMKSSKIGGIVRNLNCYLLQ